MTHTEIVKFEGTQEQLAAFLVQLSSEKRYRLVEVEESEKDEKPGNPLAVPKAAASIAFLRSWIAQVTVEPETNRAAEEEF